MSFKPVNKIEEFSLLATRWVGSTASLITHTIIFVTSFLAVLANVISFDRMLLVLTTILSLEAIYLAIFIQMTVNRQGASLEEVEHDIDEMQKDVDEIQEDIDEMQEDVEEMSEEDKRQRREAANAASLEEIRLRLERLLGDIEKLQTNN